MAKRKGEEPKTFAYEEFMAQARKEGRVRNETLSMKVLKPDLSLQARVNHLDVDHVRGLHDILKGGQQLAPIIVFEVEQPKGKAVVKAFKIADGFHRYEVYKREGLPGIPCIVVTGTLQEAIEYAASANQTMSLKRTREDIRKAVWLLLDNGWLGKSSPLIAQQVGITQPTVDKYRAAYCNDRKISVPEKLLSASGEMRTRRRKLTDPRRLYEYTENGKPSFMTKVGRQLIRFGSDRAEAEAKLAALEAHSTVGASSVSGNFTLLTQACASRGIGLLPVSSSQDTALHFVSGHRASGVAVAIWEDGRSADLLRAIASVFLIAAHWGLPRKVIVKKQADHAFDGPVAVAAKAGVEFMTLDEFVAAMKADAERKAV